MTRNLSAIPASACTLVVGDFELTSNGENSKSSKLKLIARSGRPVKHWYWGSVVHDLSGMHMHKSSLSVDYVHDPKEIIGYLNHFDIDSGDLVASGALTPSKHMTPDRALEIIDKMAQGVPYEASINFGGDGIKVQEIAEGELAEVNGYQFEGPGVVVREWPLRGVAICPYGADMNTESTVFSETNKVFSASVVTDQKATTGVEAMNKEAEDAAKLAEAEATAAAEKLEAEKIEAEAQAVEAAKLAEAKAEAEAIEAAKLKAKEENKGKEFSVEVFNQITEEFGAEVAAQTVAAGGDYSSALKLHSDAITAENVELKAKIKELEASGKGKPAPVTSAKAKGSLFNATK